MNLFRRILAALDLTSTPSLTRDDLRHLRLAAEMAEQTLRKRGNLGDADRFRSLAEKVREMYYEAEN